MVYKIKNGEQLEDVATNAGIKESLDSLFDGEDLSEEFKTKTAAIFEAAVHERVESVRAELEKEVGATLAVELEEAAADVTSKIDEYINHMTSKVDDYLNYVAEQWIEANEVTVESAIKVEVAESLMDSLRNIIAEHNLNLTDEEVDAVAELESRLEESNAKYNETVDALLELHEQKEALERDIALKTISEGLTDTQVEKLKTLSEGLSFENADEFKAKLTVIRDQYFTESVVAPEEQQVLEEEGRQIINESVSAYVSALDKLGNCR